MINSELLVDGYGDWVDGYLSHGWKGYFLTFMFRHIKGSPRYVARQMEEELERSYATFVTRVVRKPMSALRVGELPVWICSPDYPIPKHGKKSLHDVTVNDGRHFHATNLVPPKSRMKEDVTAHFEQHKNLYVRPDRPLLHVDVRPITRTPRKVVGYELKAITNGRGLVGTDEILILPRSWSEMITAGRKRDYVAL